MCLSHNTLSTILCDSRADLDFQVIGAELLQCSCGSFSLYSNDCTWAEDERLANSQLHDFLEDYRGFGFGFSLRVGIVTLERHTSKMRFQGLEPGR